MPTPFPHHYDAMLTWPGSGPAALGSEGRPTIAGGPPPEFDGERTWWSPEHLLLSSLNLCLQATFEAFARRERLHVEASSLREKNFVGFARHQRMPPSTGSRPS